MTQQTTPKSKHYVGMTTPINAIAIYSSDDQKGCHLIPIGSTFLHPSPSCNGLGRHSKGIPELSDLVSLKAVILSEHLTRRRRGKAHWSNQNNLQTSHHAFQRPIAAAHQVFTTESRWAAYAPEDELR